MICLFLLVGGWCYETIWWHEANHWWHDWINVVKLEEYVERVVICFSPKFSNLYSMANHLSQRNPISYRPMEDRQPSNNASSCTYIFHQSFPNMIGRPPFLTKQIPFGWMFAIFLKRELEARQVVYPQSIPHCLNLWGSQV